mgnify:FL=1
MLMLYTETTFFFNLPYLKFREIEMFNIKKIIFIGFFLFNFNLIFADNEEEINKDVN